MINFKIVDSYDEIGVLASKMVAEIISKNSNPVLGLATGSTPIGLYSNLIKLYNEKKLDFSKVSTVNLDEYVGLEEDNPQSYKYFMNENLFSKVNIDIKNTFLPNGAAENLLEEAKRYENILESFENIHVQILGIGSNGHIGFNEPFNELNLYTSIVDLKKETIDANSRFFEDSSMVPRKAISMGIKSILRADKIILMAYGESKAKAIEYLANDKISTDVPASFLKLHKDVHIIVDKEAAKYLK